MRMTIFAEVLAFIQRPAPEKFEPLALRVFRYQRETVAPYRTYADALNVDANEVKRLEQIPAVSTIAFKYVRLENINEPTDGASRVFLTSGTTIGRDERGRHVVPYPAIYRAASMTHLRRMLFPDGRRIAMLALHPTADRMPESSLSQMVSWGIEEFCNTVVHCSATRDGIEVHDAIQFLREQTRRCEPVCIMATTAACARLFAELATRGQTIALPPGSRLMDTGGAKGQVEPLSAAEVVDRAERRLGINPAMVINEYGMTELCSQLYDATRFNSDRSDPPGARVKLAPPWLKPFALDPTTLKPVADGAIGILTFFDLANVGSVSMVMTEDLGIVHDGMVRIIGRAQAADARGCALAIEEFARISNG
jgi:hypothetical protein